MMSFSKIFNKYILKLLLYKKIFLLKILTVTFKRKKVNLVTFFSNRMIFFCVYVDRIV